MIELKQGDILRANAEALVNTVNCVGVMGRGIALQFMKVFPENFKHYKVTCDKQELQPGKMLFHDLNRLQNPRYVVNFPTKRHWKTSRPDCGRWCKKYAHGRSIPSPSHPLAVAWVVYVGRMSGRKSKKHFGICPMCRFFFMNQRGRLLPKKWPIPQKVQ